MILTFADISTSKKVLGFSPETSTAEGYLALTQREREREREREGGEGGGGNVCVCVCVCVCVSVSGVLVGAGIHHFVQWFRGYYKDLVEWEEGGRNPSRNDLLE